MLRATLLIALLMGATAAIADPWWQPEPPAPSVPAAPTAPAGPAGPGPGAPARPAPAAPAAPSRQPAGAQQPAPTPPGTQQSPPIVKAAPDPKADEARREIEERDRKAAAEWWLVRLIAIVGVIGFVQLVVFALQSHWLRRTFQASASQVAEMQQAIAQSARTAGEMERAAKALATTNQIAAASALTNKDMTTRQLRAYVSVITAECIPQDRATARPYEIAMWATNSGQTPAHAVTIAARTQILPIPLPDSVELELPPERAEPAGHIAPNQKFYIRTLLDGVISDDEVKEITTGNRRRLYVYGTVTYKDVVGIERRTNFCQYCLWDAAGNFSTMNITRHNEAT